MTIPVSLADVDDQISVALVHTEGEVATWEQDPLDDTDPDDKGYTVYLEIGDSVGMDHAYVYIYPAEPTITINDLLVAANIPIFDYRLTADGHDDIPDLNLYFTPVEGDGSVEFCIYPDQARTQHAENTWYTVAAIDPTEYLTGMSFFYMTDPDGNFQQADPSSSQSVSDIVAQIVALDSSYGDWVLTRVKIQIGYGQALAIEAFVDNVVIDGVNYNLEPIVLDDVWYKLEETVVVYVYDYAENTRARAAEVIEVTIVSGVPDQITVELTETDINTGIFRGTFTVVDSASPGPTELLVEDATTITATYEGFYETGSFTCEAQVDVTEPTIVPDSATYTVDTVKRIDTATPDIGAVIADASSGLASVTMTLDGDTIFIETYAGTAEETISHPVPSYDPLSEDTHTVQVLVSDVAGNIVTKTWSFAVDLTKPTVTVTVSPDPVGPLTGTPDGKVTITLIFSEELAVNPVVTFGLLSPYTDEDTVETIVTGSDTVWEAIATISSGDGLNTIKVTTAEDIAGNAMLADTSTTFTIDTTSPTAPTALVATVTDVSVTLDWTASTDVDGTGVESYEIYRATDPNIDTDTTDPIDTLDSTIMTYTDFGPLTEDTYYYVVTAIDYAENKADSEEISVAFTPGDVIVYPIELFEGWNLISLPLIPDDPDTEVVLADVWDNVQVIYGYDQDEDDWIMNPDEMTDGWGYWIYLAEDDTLIVEGTETIPGMGTPVTYEYTEGWVLGGYKEITSGTEYFRSFEDDTYFDYIYVWDASELDWTMLPITTTGEYKGLVALNPGQGFWIYMYEDQVLIPPVPTP